MENRKLFDNDISEFAHSRTLYMLGLLQGEGQIDAREMDMDSLASLCKKIANDWLNMKYIQSKEEEGYPQPYAERRLLEYFNQ